MQAFLQRLVREKGEYAVLSVVARSDAGRFNGITPDVAAITNISMEHLDYHGNMDAYIAAAGAALSVV